MQLLFSAIDKRRFDIWRYKNFYPSPQLTESELITDQKVSFTTLEKRSENLLVKHEDEHPLGSHKGRSLAYQLSLLQHLGKEKLVLSSSGNAAIAFLSLTSSQHSLALISPHIDRAKLAYLQHLSSPGKLIMSSVAPQLAQALVNKKGFTDLRPSQSDDAITGLSSLGFELFEQLPDLSAEYAIVSVTTSGGNILGMYKAFETLQKIGAITSLPRFYPVLLKDYKSGNLTTARKQMIEHVVATTYGRILEMKPVYAGKELTSFEGKTALSAYEQHQNELGKTIVIFTGRIWPAAGEIASMTMYNSLLDLEPYFEF